MCVIKAVGVNKDYNGEPCLKGVNLEIERGDFVALQGESGSGKTSLLEILAGVRKPSSGMVEICGENILTLKGDALAKLRRTRLGVVYQYYSLVTTLTAGDNIRMPLSLERLPSKETEERLERVAKALRIESVLDKYPGDLSGGQQQRAAIARATVYGPEVLLLDEPTGALDSENSETVLGYLKALNEEKNTTILMITHSDRAAAAAKRVVRIKDGVLG
ncbi:MAG: ABC transporter ATP-binding protein [Clostridia bacterium]|nr:ABC transporter ATP-binding protein [Clostridia bacterium]